MTKHFELEDRALDTVQGGTDPLHLLAQVNHLQSQNASDATVQAAQTKAIIAVKPR